MAKENVHEMKAQDNGQGAAAAIEMLMHEAWEVQEELRHLSSKADLLADVNFSELSSNGESGLVFYLQDLAKKMEALGDKLQEACKAAHENL